jgi:hypothetical protein
VELHRDSTVKIRYFALCEGFLDRAVSVERISHYSADNDIRSNESASLPALISQYSSLREYISRQDRLPDTLACLSMTNHLVPYLGASPSPDVGDPASGRFIVAKELRR